MPCCYFSLHKYYITKITYFSKAYNHASFKDLKVRGTSLTSLLFHHGVIIDCKKLNSVPLCSKSHENQPADSQAEIGINAHVHTQNCNFKSLFSLGWGGGGNPSRQICHFLLSAVRRGGCK